MGGQLTLPTSNRWRTLPDIMDHFEEYKASLRPDQFNLSVTSLDLSLTSTKLRGLQNDVMQIIKDITLTPVQKAALLAKVDQILADSHQIIFDTNARLGQISASLIENINQGGPALTEQIQLIGPIIAAQIPIIRRELVSEYRSTMGIIKICLVTATGTYIIFKVCHWFWK